jgi:hypothetical protein
MKQMPQPGRAQCLKLLSARANISDSRAASLKFEFCPASVINGAELSAPLPCFQKVALENAGKR